MKTFLSLVIGISFVLAFGLVRAEENATGTDDTAGKMITNDDLSRFVMDPDRATVNQMPAQPGYEGSGAGGVSGGDLDNEMDQNKESVDKVPAEPGAEGSAGGGVYKDSDTWKRDDSGQGNAPGDKPPVDTDRKGPGMGGPSTDMGMPGK